MKKIILSILVLFTMLNLNAQKTTFIKYEFMKVLPGQDYEQLEKSWINYHKEQIKEGVINLHRIWKVLPGSNVDYDYVVTTAYNTYADALGLGKSISINDFKAKYPEDYQVMNTKTLSTRTMVKEYILSLTLGISDTAYQLVPGQTMLNMIFIKSKNDKYQNAEVNFSKKWHQGLVDKKRKEGFYFSNVVGSNGIDVEFSHVISHMYKNVDQLTAASNVSDLKFTPQDQAELNQLVTYRDLKKSTVLVNVMNLEK